MKSSNPFNILSEHFFTGKYGQLFGNDKMVVLFEKLPEWAQYTIEVLTKSLGTTPNNLGLANLKNGTVFHSIGFFGIKLNDAGDEVMGLQLGCDKDEFQSIFIPCEVEKTEKVISKSRTINQYNYTLNGWNLQLIKPTLESDKSYIQLTVYDTPNTYIDGDGIEQIEEVDEADLKFEFVFPFLHNKDCDVDVNKSWINGTFNECLRQFGTFKLYGQANKLFYNSFSRNNFPKGGVYLLCRDGKKRITKAGSHPKVTKDILSSIWEIYDVSHPELLVSVNDEITEFGNVGYIQFTNAVNGNEGYNFFDSHDIESHAGFVLIHVVAPNYNNIKHMPVNVVAYHPSHVKNLMDNFVDGVSPMFIAKTKNIMLTPTDVLNVEVIPTKTSISPKKVTTSNDLDDIAF